MNFSPTQILITYVFFQYLSFFTLWMEHNKLKNELYDMAERTSSVGSCEGTIWEPEDEGEEVSSTPKETSGCSCFGRKRKTSKSSGKDEKKQD
jgi:hypothetical protein